jgi:hypothetical protein
MSVRSASAWVNLLLTTLSISSENGYIWFNMGCMALTSSNTQPYRTAGGVRQIAIATWPVVIRCGYPAIIPAGILRSEQTKNILLVGVS